VHAGSRQGAEGRCGIDIGGGGTDAVLKPHIPEEPDSTLSIGQSVFPASGLAVISDQFVQDKKFTAVIPRQFSLFQPVEQVPLGPGKVPAAHIFIEFRKYALLRYRSAPGLRFKRIAAQRAVGLQILFGSQRTMVAHIGSLLFSQCTGKE
jgi:hypothetical protein